MRLVIQKLAYSSHPWRLVDLDGQGDYSGPEQILVPVEIDHPVFGRTTTDEAVSGSTKAQCIERTLAILGRLIEQRRRQIAEQSAMRIAAEPQSARTQRTSR